MISNAPEFLANVAAAIYEEDPIGFDIRNAWARAATSIDNLSSGIRAMEIGSKIAINAFDGLAVIIEKKCLRPEFHYEGREDGFAARRAPDDPRMEGKR